MTTNPTAPAAMPSEADLDRLCADLDTANTAREPQRCADLMDEARVTIIAMRSAFAPILAEKEREIERMKQTRLILDRRIHCQRMSNRANWMIVEQRSFWMRRAAQYFVRRGKARLEARALAAEAALAAERERVEQLYVTTCKAHVAMTMACALPGVASEYDFSEAIASTEAALDRRATAIRAQGE